MQRIHEAIVGATGRRNCRRNRLRRSRNEQPSAQPSEQPVAPMVAASYLVMSINWAPPLIFAQLHSLISLTRLLKGFQMEEEIEDDWLFLAAAAACVTIIKRRRRRRFQHELR